MLVITRQDLIGILNYSCPDEFYRKRVIEFLERKYFGNGKMVNSFYRLFTVCVSFINYEELKILNRGMRYNRDLTFRIKKYGGVVRIKREENSSSWFDTTDEIKTKPFFRGRLYRFMDSYIEELTGFKDKELIDKTTMVLEDLVKGFENYIITTFEDKVSYNAMRINMCLTTDDTIIVR